MKHLDLFLIIALLMMHPAVAAEDNPSTPDPNNTAAVAGDANPNVEQKNPLRFLVGAGLTVGGDKLGTMTYSDGSTDSITAGGLLMLYGGLDYRLNNTFSLQGTLGYHFDATKKATNGEVTFSRIPLELLAYYHISEAIRLGAGIRYVASPRIKGSGIASSANDSFDNATGVAIEGEFMATPILGIKVRHVTEKYRKTGFSGSIDGSHFGVLASVYF